MGKPKRELEGDIMKATIETFITDINEYAENNQLFWVCAIAKDCLPIFKNNLDKLHPIARIAVDHYIKEQSK